MEFELPYPPSINHYYRHVGPRVLISREGRKYHERVTAVVRAGEWRTLQCPVELTIELYPPDRRVRDADNCIKPVQDALQNAGLFVNDSQVKDLHVYMREPLAGGLCHVEIRKRKR
ncbi:MAG: RusA family crossover junction endodeoxyribonuclease [Victivallaceae bacterium]|nr:RusA family crossover junction endodeoxyribonuclease [Victivallaceae bacterium]